MIRINLLPHREMRRERRKRDFVSLAAVIALLGAGVALLVGLAINTQIDSQEDRNRFIQAENDKLDAQIREIATLRADIDALRARQQAVEELQSNRTIPVHLLDELVRNTPEGIYLKTLTQLDRRLLLVGYAQTNERVAEFLRNLAGQTTWMDKPELTEIKSVRIQVPDEKEDRRIFEFSLNALVRTASDREKDAKKAALTAAPAKASTVASN